MFHLFRYAGYGVLAVYALWIFFLAAMAIRRARSAGTLTRSAKILAIPVEGVGIALDVFVNVFVMSVLMLEIPHEWTVTARLQRHITGTDFRQKIAVWMAVNMLNLFDPAGPHIKLN